MGTALARVKRDDGAAPQQPGPSPNFFNLKNKSSGRDFAEELPASVRVER
jgi:hypothetical protein